MATVIGTIYLNGCNYQIAYDLISQSVENNTSKIRFYGILNVTNNYISWSSGSAWVHNSSTGIGTYYSRGSYTLVTAEQDFKHDDNTGELYVSVGFGLNTTFVSGNSVSETIHPPKIERYARITNWVTSFTDEENPWFEFSNPNNTTMSCWLEPKPVGEHIAIRTVTGTSGRFTWDLTEDEREALRNACTDATSCICRIGLYSTMGGTTRTDWKDKTTLNIVNATPTFTASSKELNEKVIELIGDDTGETLVQNISKFQLTINPTAYKGATIKSVTVLHNGNTLTKNSAPYIFDIVPVGNKFTITVTDSRQITTTPVEITKNVIEYQPVSIKEFKFERLNPTSSTILLNFTGTYYQATFKDVPNKVKVEWRLNEGEDGLFPSDDLFPSDNLYLGGEYIEIPDTEYQIEDNQIIINNYWLENILDYTEKGILYIKISDIFSEAFNNTTVIRGIPVMEWGETDVQINGDLYIADTDRNNPVNVLDLVHIKPKKSTDSNGWVCMDFGTYKRYFKTGTHTQTFQASGWGGAGDLPLPSDIDKFNSSTMDVSVSARCADAAVGMDGAINNNATFIRLHYRNNHNGSITNTVLYDVVLTHYIDFE